MPSVASTAASGERVNVPASTMNSEMNGASPGRERLDRPARSSMPDRIGACFCTPPKSLMLAEPRRAIMMPVIRNNAAVDMPWLNM